MVENANNAINEKVLAHLHNFYHENPYVQLLGIKVASVERGRVTLYMESEEKLSNFYHIAHGGALMSLADTAMGATCLSVNKKVVTQSMNSFFLKASREGAHLTATGHILHNGRKTVVCETEIRDEEGIVLCKATANFFVIGQCVEEQA
ncbi:MAG: PaaI family thioesterase [Selenomonadaceae bacterium]|nr:PaaI family thioesterase [Selenomonadaceae bacterium]